MVAIQIRTVGESRLLPDSIWIYTYAVYTNKIKSISGTVMCLSHLVWTKDCHRNLAWRICISRKLIGRTESEPRRVRARGKVHPLLYILVMFLARIPVTKCIVEQASWNMFVMNSHDCGPFPALWVSTLIVCTAKCIQGVLCKFHEHGKVPEFDSARSRTSCGKGSRHSHQPSDSFPRMLLRPNGAAEQGNDMTAEVWITPQMVVHNKL